MTMGHPKNDGTTGAAMGNYSHCPMPSDEMLMISQQRRMQRLLHNHSRLGEYGVYMPERESAVPHPPSDTQRVIIYAGTYSSTSYPWSWVVAYRYRRVPPMRAHRSSLHTSPVQPQCSGVVYVRRPGRWTCTHPTWALRRCRADTYLATRSN